MFDLPGFITVHIVVLTGLTLLPSWILEMMKR